MGAGQGSGGDDLADLLGVPDLVAHCDVTPQNVAQLAQNAARRRAPGRRLGPDAGEGVGGVIDRRQAWFAAERAALPAALG